MKKTIIDNLDLELYSETLENKLEIYSGRRFFNFNKNKIEEIDYEKSRIISTSWFF